MFIYFSAKRPEFFKITFYEICNESHRAEWLLDEVLAPIHRQARVRVNANIPANTSKISDAHFHSLSVGAANISFKTFKAAG